MDLKKTRDILKNTNLKVLSVEEILELCESCWSYGGGKYHALLTSGLHSDYYSRVNSALQFSNVEEELADRLATELSRLGITYVDCVVSSSSAAITLGKAVSTRLGSMFIYTEKKEGGQALTDRFELSDGTNILQVEELITTEKTTKAVREAVLKRNPNVNFLKHNGKILVLTILHRPSDINVEQGDEIVSLLRRQSNNWKPEECPLCKEGSVAVAPKPNWSLFIRN